MKGIDKLIFICLIILILFNISCVSATQELDTNSTTIPNSSEWNNNLIQEDIDYKNILTQSVDETDLCKTDTKEVSYDPIENIENFTISDSSQNNALKEAKGDFNLLQDLINNAYENSAITLNQDYTFTEGLDDNLIEGILVNKYNLKIDGNGYIINALGKARIFKLTESEVTLTNIIFMNGYGYDGGAVYVNDNDYFCVDSRIYNCSFVNNTAKNNGGAIYWENEGGIISECTFINNTANKYGGAIEYSGYYGTLNNCTYINNTAEYGGAIYWENEGSSVSDCTFINNAANKYGGALYWRGPNDVRAFNCSFVNNTAINGGAIYWSDDDITDQSLPNIYVSNCEFMNNYASHDGGAISCESHNSERYSNSRISNCSFVNNCANSSGGAVSWNVEFDIVFDYCSFLNNTANSGSAIIGYGPYGNIFGCRFVNNSAKTGTVQWHRWVGYVSNSSFVDNKAKSESLSCEDKDSLIFTLVGTQNYINAIYSYAASFIFENVTYYNGFIVNSDKVIPIESYNESGINITVEIFDSNGDLIDNATIMTNKEGQVIYDYLNLESDDYTYKAYHTEDNYYTYIETTGNFSVYKDKKSSKISGVYDSNNNELTFTLLEADCEIPVKYANIVVVSNGIKYDLKTDSNGQAKISTADLTPGTYTATAYYNGNSKYNSTNESVDFIVKTNTRVSVVYKDNTKELVVNLANDLTNQPILGATIRFKINNKYYTNKTDNSGQSKLSVANLPFGTYTATVSYGGNAKYNPSSANVNIPIKANTSFNVVYNANDKELIATLMNNVTGQVIKGGTVGIVLNNVRTTLKTDTNGQIKFSTKDLNSGIYPTTVSYGGNTKYNSTKTTLDIMINVKTNISAVYKNGILTATLINNATGKGINGADLLVSFGDVNYTVKTNFNGQANVSTRDLTPGSYTAVVSFDDNGGNPSNASIPIQVKTYVYFIAKDISTEFNTNAELVATLINYATGKGIVGATVGFKINGKSYTAKTDSNGQAKVSLSGLNPGNYNTVVSYNGNTKYNPSSTTFNVLVNKITTGFSVYYDNQTNEIVATLINEATGKGVVGGTVGIFLNSVKNIIVTDTNGQARLSLGNVNPNSFTAYVSYAGNTKYFGSSRTLTPVENKMESYISTAYNKQTDEVVATLINKATGKGVIGGTVNIVVNNVRNNLKTDKNGQAKVSIAELTPNIISVTSSYAGNTKYTATTEVKSFVKV